jgi:hypothetical protein
MCLFYHSRHKHMSNIRVGNCGRGGAATAITVSLILMASPAILMTGAFAAPKIDKGCKDIQFQTRESPYLDN